MGNINSRPVRHFWMDIFHKVEEDQLGYENNMHAITFDKKFHLNSSHMSFDHWTLRRKLREKKSINAFSKRQMGTIQRDT